MIESRRFLSLVLLLLAGCSSVPQTHLFQLPLAVQDSETTVKVQQQLVVEPIILADYLDSNALILRKSEVEVDRTQQQQWAEPLQLQLSRSLVPLIQANVTTLHVTNRATAPSHLRLLVQVDQFEGDMQGQVHVRGRYSLLSSNGVQQYQFAVQLAQPEAGYPALVATLATAWRQVAAEIAQAMTQFVEKQGQSQH